MKNIITVFIFILFAINAIAQVSSGDDGGWGTIFSKFNQIQQLFSNEDEVSQIEFNALQEELFRLMEPIERDSVYAHILAELAYYNSQLKNNEEAIKLDTEAINIIKNNYGTSHPFYGVLLNELALFYNEINLNDEAIKKGRELLELTKKNEGIENPNYVSALDNLTLYYSSDSQDSIAVELATEAIGIKKKLLGEDNYEYAISLDDLVVMCSDAGYYDKALNFSNEAVSIFKKILGDKHPEYGVSLENRARVLSSAGNYKDAIDYYLQAIDIYTATQQALPFFRSSIDLVGCYSQLKNYEDALKYGLICADIIKNSMGADNRNYVIAIARNASFYSELGKYDEAIRLGTEAVILGKNVFGEDNIEYSNAVANLASYHASINEYDKAIQLMNEVITIREKLSDITPQVVANSHVKLELFYLKNGNIRAAKEHEAKALSITESSFGGNSAEYASLLSEIAACYGEIENYAEAVKFTSRAINIYRNNAASNSKDYIYTLKNHAEYNNKLDNYLLAIDSNKEALERLNEMSDTVDIFLYADIFNALSHDYSGIGEFEKSINYAQEALKIYQANGGPNQSGYTNILLSLSTSLFFSGNYAEAIRYVKEALEVSQSSPNANKESLALSLSNLAGYYFFIGNYDEAIKLGTEAVKTCKIVYGPDSRDYAISLDNLSVSLRDIGEYDEAIKTELEALSIFKECSGIESTDYATTLLNLAGSYSAIGDYIKAEKQINESLNIRRKLLGDTHPEYATALSVLADIENNSGNFLDAIEHGTQTVDIRRKTLGEKHPDYAKSLEKLGLYYLSINDFNKAYNYQKSSLEVLKNHMLKQFSTMLKKERDLYWNDHSSQFVSYFPWLTTKIKTPEAIGDLYNTSALFAKGLLLAAETELSHFITESGDEDIAKKYNELRLVRMALNQQYEKAISERILNTDSLEQVAQKLERELMQQSKVYGDYTRNLSITWQDVQGKLDGNGIAIEFLSYPEQDGEIHYAALTLCKNDTTPMLTPLFIESKLIETSGGSDSYQTEAADALIWGPLSYRLEGKAHVYFSASRILHNIGIEYLPSMEGKNCYRLSSTRELVTQSPNETLRSATLYGDIDYDATYASIESSIPSSVRDYAMNETSRYRGYYDYRSINNGVSSLPGTKVELDELSALMKPLGVSCDKMTGVQASEESFKALSGQRKSLLHISTHGFYYNDEKANSLKPHLRQMLMGDDRPSHAEDKSLLRCGLCFAGANQTLLGKSKPSEGQGDGILNALEIAQTDLRGLDLVVLSACQTALGDVSQGEGVFGLQRGFKKAGAKSILMTLWNVEDLTTQLLMVEFYKNYLSGKSKHESLRKAQQYVRDYTDEKGNKLFDDPHYWAGFILLDALD